MTSAGDRDVIDGTDIVLIVFTTNAQLPPWLEDWAADRNAIALCAATVRRAIREVVRRLPDAVIVYFDDASQLKLTSQLLSELRIRRPRVALAAVVPVHNEVLELAARSAGAHLYFAGPHELQALDASLLALRSAPRQRPRSPPSDTRDRIRGRPPPATARRLFRTSLIHYQEEES